VIRFVVVEDTAASPDSTDKTFASVSKRKPSFGRSRSGGQVGPRYVSTAVRFTDVSAEGSLAARSLRGGRQAPARRAHHRLEDPARRTAANGGGPSSTSRRHETWTQRPGVQARWTRPDAGHAATPSTCARSSPSSSSSPDHSCGERGLNLRGRRAITPLQKKLGLRLDAFRSRRRWPSACRVLPIDRGFHKGQERSGRRSCRRCTLPRDEGLRRVHLRRIRDADLFENCS
jgi:hypothetical protein